MTKSYRWGAALATAALVFTACGDAPEETATADPTASGSTASSPAPSESGSMSESVAPTDAGTAAETEPAITFEGSGFSACQVTDTGGVDDRSFNQTAYKGMLDAEAMGVEISLLESTNAADYEPNISTFLEQGCDVIITAGFAIGEATAAAADANPDQPFAIVDFNFTAPGATEEDPPTEVEYDNARELIYQTDEAAFLAGYLAAGMTETDTIATYGGLPFPTVTIFMDGFLAGALHYNEVNDANVEVLGWDGNPDTGTFVNTFDDDGEGRKQGDAFLAAGADIIMPVAGPVGAGTGAAMREAGTGSLIWVDTDGFETFSEYSDLMLTSVEKKMDLDVLETIGMVINDDFESGLHTGTLENGRVDIAPLHEFEGEVPQELKDELETLRAEIIAGDRSVSPADYQ